MENFNGRVHKCTDCEGIFLTFIENAKYCPYCSCEKLLVNMDQDYAQEELQRILKTQNPIKLVK